MDSQKKRFYFLGGLPRSGSTLLCNILAQNPRFHTTHTSGCLDIIFGVRNNWNTLIEHRAHPDEAAQKRVMRAILEAYHAPVNKPVVIDKSRGWISLIEMAEWVLDRRVKILVPVRDIREILASFEKLWQQQAHTSQFAAESDNYFDFQTVEGRCEFWTRKDQPVGLAYNRLKDALQRGHRDRLHFIHFHDLTTSPRKTLSKIYSFLGEPPYEHNFKQVEQTTVENDRVHGIKNLHKIRPEVKPVPLVGAQILGGVAEQYADANFWDKF